MKALKLSLIIILMMFVTVGLSGMAYAMHSGGTGYCEACHTMHNSLGGVSARKGGTVDVGVNYLLKGSDQSSTCLNCHASVTPQNTTTGNGISIMTYPIPGATAPYYRSPGGDFAWIGKTYGTGTQNPGYTHGHNINAIDYGLPVGSPLATTAPGGTYLQSHLHCSSCHNPHSSSRLTGNPVSSSNEYNSITSSGALQPSAIGPITGSGSSSGFGTIALPTPAAPLGVYRLLGDVGYVPVSYSGGSPFSNPPPVAVAPSTYNLTEATNEVRVAYGSGMSQWCANCHAAIYANVATGSAGNHIHPNGPAALLTATANISGSTTYSYANIYNAYISSGNLTGKQPTSYTSLVPYEEGISDMGTLGSHATYTAPMYTTAGPSTGTENVHCLTCHRAHASGFPQATRWYNNYQFITLAGGVWPGATPGSSSNYMPQLDYQAAMYDHSASVFGTTGFQRPLCNKCHGKD